MALALSVSHLLLLLGALGVPVPPNCPWCGHTEPRWLLAAGVRLSTPPALNTCEWPRDEIFSYRVIKLHPRDEVFSCISSNCIPREKKTLPTVLLSRIYPVLPGVLGSEGSLD